MDKHEKYIRRCIEIALLGSGNVSPNPLVGSVIVLNDRIIGEGWHQQYGKAHAEVNAINSVKNPSKLNEATIYISLEPCFHHGKTPPCVDLILKHSIPRVVIASKDPNAKVGGKSIEKLKNAGIEVISGICDEEARSINKGFFMQHLHHRPYIILKWAESKDCYFAPLEGHQWLSNPQSKRLTHKLRNHVDAIMVGKNTVIHDNPRLNDRFWQGHDPVRIVIDPKLELKKDNHIYTDGLPTVIFNAKKNADEAHIKFIKLDHYSFSIDAMIKQLNELNINTLLVEGGAFTLNNFVDSDNWDQAFIYKTSVLLDYGIDAIELNQYHHKEEVTISTDRLEIYYRS